MEKSYKEYQSSLDNLLKEQNSSLEQMHSRFQEGVKKCEFYKTYLEELELKDNVHPDALTHFSKNRDGEKLLNSLNESYQSGKSGSLFSLSSWKNWFFFGEIKPLLQAQLKDRIEESEQELSVLENTHEVGLHLQQMAKDGLAKIQEIEIAQKNMTSLRQNIVETEQNLIEISTLERRQRMLENTSTTLYASISYLANALSEGINPKVKSCAQYHESLKQKINAEMVTFEQIGQAKDKITVQLSRHRDTLFSKVTEQRRENLTFNNFSR